MGNIKLDIHSFLEEFNIPVEKFYSTGLPWDKLCDVYDSYLLLKPSLEPIINFIAQTLRKNEYVHSLKLRIKNEKHVIEKIIRKKITNADYPITLDNFKEKITDIIGVRAIHLYKEDWKYLHEFITTNWNLAENPTAYHREGDPEAYTQSFKAMGCETKIHPYGYRSVHYIIKTKPCIEEYLAEIQVRTIFEEGWSEIDHRIRYPYDVDNPILTPYLLDFNVLAGLADNMGTYVNSLKNEINKIMEDYKENLADRDSKINELNAVIDALKIEQKEKEQLQAKFDELTSKFSRQDQIQSLADRPALGGALARAPRQEDSNTGLGLLIGSLLGAAASPALGIPRGLGAVGGGLLGDIFTHSKQNDANKHDENNETDDDNAK